MLMNQLLHQITGQIAVFTNQAKGVIFQVLGLRSLRSLRCDKKYMYCQQQGLCVSLYKNSSHLNAYNFSSGFSQWRIGAF